MARRDDERARLARDVDERRLPRVAVVGGRGDVDLDAGLVEREARERHVVLPADQPADAGRAGLDRAQPAAVALAPDEPLVVRRHELAVVQRERAVGRVVEQRVVERAGPLGVDLVDAGDEPDAVLARDRAEPVARRARAPRPTRARAARRPPSRRVRPAGERLGPDRRRVRGDERLREDDELRARAGGLGGQRRELVERRLAVEHDRLGLDAGDVHGFPHVQVLSHFPPLRPMPRVR